MSLFGEGLEPLDLAKHKQLRFSPSRDFGFARQVRYAPLSASEAVAASRDYPVVFSTDEQPVAVALLSLGRGDSPFVDDEGQWRGRYVPAHLRRYPFVLGRTSEAGRFVMMIDPAADQFSREEGELLVSDGGIPEDGVVARARTFLLRFERELNASRSFYAPLAEHDLLAEREVRSSSGDVLRGVRVVDQEKLSALDAQTTKAWLDSGLLGQVFAHIHSLRDVDKLVVQERH